jgi:(p)ppGpp synthase/HD superfamily hydrolase
MVFNTTPSQMRKLIKIIRFCEKHYDAETFAHAMRVACISTNLSNKEDKGELFVSALCHDLIEDTEVTLEKLREVLLSSHNHDTDYTYCLAVIERITRKKETETYQEYIKRIKEKGCCDTKIIKIADLTDHLEQKDTLKSSLKDRYVDALCELLD